MYSYSKNKYTTLAKILLFLCVIQPLFFSTLAWVHAEESPTEAEIVTGDAYAESLTETLLNTNLIETTSSSTPTEVLLETVSGSSSLPTAGVEDEPSIITTSSTNSAIIDTTSTTSAETGSNTASGETATIVTGEGYAVANVVNLANTNIQNSSGLIDFLTSLGVSTLDVRSFFDTFSTMPVSTPTCTLDACSDENVLYQSHSSSSALISNSVVVRAQTGGNVINANGEASISSGNAYAAANIFNVANTNITDSNYLLVSVNNLGNLPGDIVLPAAHLLNSLFGRSALLSAGQTITNDNQAAVANTISSVADTGNNQSTGGAIETGQAFASSDVRTTVNQNRVGADSFFLLIRVHGNWSGDIYGLPTSMRWSETDQGITIYTPESDEATSSKHSYSDTVANTNSAQIRNNVSVFALTGENKIETEGSSNIESGNAYASASIVNLANLNILSQNWALLLFDIFGDWDGNISFGRPDLWVGVQASSPKATIMPGSFIDYTFTVSNLGDTPAHQVTLDTLYNPSQLQFASGVVYPQANGSAKVTIPVGTLAPGSSREIIQRVKVSESLSRREKTALPLTATVLARETEDDVANNTDSITVEAGKSRRSSPGPKNTLSTSADVIVEKTANVATTTAPKLVDYQITLTNLGGTLYNAVLFDTLEDQQGNLLHKEFWELGTIAAGEIVTITYSTNYGTTTKLGLYRNTAELMGNHQTSLPNGKNTYTASSTAVVEISDTVPTPQVLGVATSSCEQYLSSFLRYGGENPATEIGKLKDFLRVHLAIDLPLTGFFDRETLAAVKAFQARYKDEVLKPWGMSEPSGYVYLTTRKMINELQCNGLGSFPLTEA